MTTCVTAFYFCHITVLKMLTLQVQWKIAGVATALDNCCHFGSISFRFQSRYMTEAPWIKKEHSERRCDDKIFILQSITKIC